MIASVRGRVRAVGPASAVVEVAGIGIEVQCAPGTLATLTVGGDTTLPTSLVVREESLTLFGFVDDDERSVFELLQTASGVGPKLAQAMLAVHPPDELRRAVATEDLGALMQVPGVGRKGAQRIVLELKDRLGAPVGRGHAGPASQLAPAGHWREQVHTGLVGLGWSAREADGAVDAVAPIAHEQQSDDAVDVPTLLRAALRTLSRT